MPSVRVIPWIGGFESFDEVFSFTGLPQCNLTLGSSSSLSQNNKAFM